MSKMHADEVDIDSVLVSRLIAARFPRWAALPLELVRSAGTNNALYRLGSDMAARLPRIPGVVKHQHKEQQWLQELAPHLPLAIPAPLAIGEPGEGYPWPWAVYRWLDGESAERQGISDEKQAVHDLAHFISALQRIDFSRWQIQPSPSSRSGPLSRRDRYVREAIAELSSMLNTDAVTRAWEKALQAPEWAGLPVLTHGDLLPGNMVVQQGRISAIIDFEGLRIGDPACDLIPAWCLLSRQTRPLFREALSVDNATWERGRGWALSIGLIALPYYQHTNPVFAVTARHMIDEVLADYE